MIVWVQLAMTGVLAAALVLLGRYGWSNAAQLVPGHLDAEGALRKERALRRGSAICFAAAALLVIAAVLPVWAALTR